MEALTLGQFFWPAATSVAEQGIVPMELGIEPVGVGIAPVELGSTPNFGAFSE